MAFCSKCGMKLKDDAKFCSECGKPVVQYTAQQPVIPASQPFFKQEFIGSAIVLKYQKSAMFMMLTEPLDVTLDGQLHFTVTDGRDICYNVAPGDHTLSIFIPYIAGAKYGAVTKTFSIEAKEVLEILYKPPVAMFMAGIVAIKKV